EIAGSRFLAVAHRQVVSLSTAMRRPLKSTVPWAVYTRTSTGKSLSLSAGAEEKLSSMPWTSLSCFQHISCAVARKRPSEAISVSVCGCVSVGVCGGVGFMAMSLTAEGLANGLFIGLN